MVSFRFKKKWNPVFVSDHEAQIFITQRLEAGTTFNRVGTTELKVLLHVLNKGTNLPAKIRQEAQYGAGYYYETRAELIRFCDQMLAIHDNSNYIASFPTLRQREYEQILNYNPAKRLQLGHYEPYKFKANYFRFFHGKKITVVSSFVHTVSAQLPKFGQLHKFISEEVEFQLVGAPQTNAGFYSDGISWQTRLLALIKHCELAGNQHVLIGAGSYGPILASELSKRGYTSMVIGGGIQLLFGIYGRRWYQREDFQQLFNEHWVWPLDEDIPKGHRLVEDSCYWK